MSKGKAKTLKTTPKKAPKGSKVSKPHPDKDKKIDLQAHTAPTPKENPDEEEKRVSLEAIEDYVVIEVLGYPYYVSAQKGPDDIVYLEVCSKRRKRPNSDEFDKVAFMALDEYETLLKQGTCEFLRICPVQEEEESREKPSIARRASKATAAPPEPLEEEEPEEEEEEELEGDEDDEGGESYAEKVVASRREEYLDSEDDDDRVRIADDDDDEIGEIGDEDHADDDIV